MIRQFQCGDIVLVYELVEGHYLVFSGRQSPPINSIPTSAWVYVLAHYVQLNADDQRNLTSSSSAKEDFKKENPCPSTGENPKKCPGYWLGYVVGSGSLIQWHAIEEKKKKPK
jgi:hypothetical protein